MNLLPAAVNRLVALIVGAALIVVGAAAITWELKVTWVRDRIADIDASWFDRAPDQSWWIWVVVGVAVGGIVLGLGLLLLDVRPRKTGSVALAGTDSSGILTLNPGKVAGAVAQDLARDPAILHARGRAIDDRKRRLLEITVTADPGTDYAAVLAAVGRSQQQLAAALQGSDLRPRFLIHVNKNTKRARVR